MKDTKFEVIRNEDLIIVRHLLDNGGITLPDKFLTRIVGRIEDGWSFDSAIAEAYALANAEVDVDTTDETTTTTETTTNADTETDTNKKALAAFVIGWIGFMLCMIMFFIFMYNQSLSAWAMHWMLLGLIPACILLIAMLELI